MRLDHLLSMENEKIVYEEVAKEVKGDIGIFREHRAKRERKARESRSTGESRKIVVQFPGTKEREKGNRGGVAQLGEHLPCKQGVMGSNPIISTNGKVRRRSETAGSL